MPNGRTHGIAIASPARRLTIGSDFDYRALDNARLETFGGDYDAIAIGKMVNQTEILELAMQLLTTSF